MSWTAPRNDEAAPAQATAQPASSPSGGLGDAPANPIAALPPIEPTVDGIRLDPKTGEPVRSVVVKLVVALFTLAALVAFVGYWLYWWQAINIRDFSTASGLIKMFDPRPGSGSSIVIVCVMAAVGAAMVAAPGVAAYNTWNGAPWSRWAGVGACLTGLLAVFLTPWTWAALGLAALGTLVLFTPLVKGYFAQWRSYLDPTADSIQPPDVVEYGPIDRFR